MELAAGKGAAKNWKFTVRMVEPDGSAGRVFKKWLDETGRCYPALRPAAGGEDCDARAAKKARAKAALEKRKEKKARKRPRHARIPGQARRARGAQAQHLQQNLEAMLEGPRP